MSKSDQVRLAHCSIARRKNIKMLSAETAAGAYPTAAVQIMYGVIEHGFWCRQRRGLAIMGYGASQN